MKYALYCQTGLLLLMMNLKGDLQEEAAEHQSI
jgi:hypothetical protein